MLSKWRENIEVVNLECESDLEPRLLKAFVKSGFSILVLGERGVGKTTLVESLNCKVKSFNCASFAKGELARSELFGYVKGAFTGATKDAPGIIKESENGILFMDEIHHLPKSEQALLLKTFETNSENIMKVYPIGATKPKEVKDCQLVFGSNRSIKELQKVLLPDFYDRIAQHILEIPPLRDRGEKFISRAWRKICRKFFPKEMLEGSKLLKDDSLKEWILDLGLRGNYRDLERIARLYKVYEDFEEEIKEALPYKSAITYTKQQYQKYNYSTTPQSDDDLVNYLFNEVLTDEIDIKRIDYGVSRYKRLLYEKVEKEYSNLKQEERAAKIGIKATKTYRDMGKGGEPLEGEIPFTSI